MGTDIHPTAIVGKNTEIGDGCMIGPYVIIEDGAVLGGYNELNAHSYIFGSLRMGSRNRLMRGASLGGEPQSRDYKGEPTRLLVGSDNWFGENLTIHRGTVDTGETVVGDHNFLMACIHVGHDCRLGNHITMANDSKLGGHSVLQDRVTLGAGVGVHQFTRVGELVMAAALSRVIRDVLPFTIVRKDDTLFGLNRVGLRRAGYSKEESRVLHSAYKMFCQQRKPHGEVLHWMAEQPSNPLLEAWIAFLSTPSKSGYARARPSAKRGGEEEGEKSPGGHNKACDKSKRQQLTRESLPTVVKLTAAPLTRS